MLNQAPEMFTAKQVYELISAGMIRSAVKLHEERTKNEQQALVIQQLQNDLAATEERARVLEREKARVIEEREAWASRYRTASVSGAAPATTLDELVKNTREYLQTQIDGWDARCLRTREELSRAYAPAEASSNTANEKETTK